MQHAEDEEQGAFAAEEAGLVSRSSERRAYYTDNKHFSAHTNTTRSRRRAKAAAVPSFIAANRRRPPRTSFPYSTTDAPPTSLIAMGSAMLSILSLYVKHHSLALRKKCRRRKKFLLLSIVAVCLFLLLWIAFLALSFYMDATHMCTPPRDLSLDGNRPLVEYYIHGHGNGHYARSITIIERLNQAGVDVRMFIGRATIWNFYHQAKPMLGGNKGTTTAIAVTSLQPSLGFFASLSHVLERIMGDCEVARQTRRYPTLVISDGDMPGMFRAYFGNIPSVGISHGQIFSISKKPDWVLEDSRLNRAWDKQGSLNYWTAFFSSWQIGTDFGYLETKRASAVVARPPLRPEVLHMAAARRQGIPLHFDAPTAHRMANLVLKGKDDATAADSNTTLPTRRRKIVLAYFRDHNGEGIIDSLLQAGFDVMLFETGYNKKLDQDPNRYGKKWIVGKEDRIKLREQFDSKPRVSHDRRRRLSEMTIQRRLSSTSSSPRLIRVVDRALFVPFMSIADGIVASAGSQLISECIFANLPLLALYRMHDDEQVLNVELSRQERVLRRKIPVYGASFENLDTAIIYKNATSKLPVFSSGVKVARSELESFVDKVHESTVSEAYFHHLQEPSSSSIVTTHNISSSLPPNPEDDPFHGMPDAAAIIMEIIKQVENDTI